MPSASYSPRTAEIEARVLDLCDRVEKGSAIEYDLLEFKREWLEPRKAARRLAAHANAARGENVMWVIGPDEKAKRVRTAAATELSTWWPAVKACFENGHAPALVRDVDVTFERTDGTREHVCALVFDTEPAPYIVTIGKAPAEGMPDLEVPWREGRRTRTARRSDLLRLLLPVSKRLQIDLLDGDLTHYVKTGRWILALGMYIVPPPNERQVLPFHLVDVVLRLPDREIALELHGLEGLRDATGVLTGGSELVIDGPGYANLEGRADTERNLVGAALTLHVSATFESAHGERYTLERDLIPVRGPADEYHWRVEGHKPYPPVRELGTGFDW